MTYPAGPPTPPPYPDGSQAVCVRHPDRATGLTCTRCEQPACPECLREASVGYQCVDCVGAAARTGRRGTTVAGAEPGGRSVVVPALVAINLAVFALTAVQAGSIGSNHRSELFADWVLVPEVAADGEWWRLLTAGFLHYGPIHVAVNMLALWLLGRDLEVVLGRGRFVAVYLLALLGGSAAVVLFSASDSATAGASGAVFGLMGGLLVVMRRLRIPPGQVIGLIALNVALSFVIPSISIVGHLGGLVVGAAATVALVYAPARNRVPVQVGALVGLTVLLIVVIVTATSVRF
jgi:membrane associated rhomboid family serine protease